MGTHFRTVAYVADSSVFCVACAEERYPALVNDDVAYDREGNEVGALFQWDDTSDFACDACFQPIDDTL